MKRHWNEMELADGWSLTHDEYELLNNRTKRSRLGFAVLLKFFQLEGRFHFFASSYNAIPLACQTAMDLLMQAPDEAESEKEATPFAELRLDPGRPSLESVLNEIEKLQRIVDIGLPGDLFGSVASSVIQKYRLRAATEPPRELRRHPKPIRYTLAAAFCWQRKKEIIDGLVDLTPFARS